MDHSRSLKICSYNVHNFHKRDVRPQKFAFLQSLLESHTFLCIQEHWLYESKIKKVIGALKPGCNVVGCSPMDERVRRVGRPYGGCAIVWESSANFRAEEVPCDNKRICALEVEMLNNYKLMIVNVYMPSDDGRPQTLDEFRVVVHEVQRLILERDPDDVCFLGDLNTSFTRNCSSMRSRVELICELQNVFGMSHKTSTLPHTFINSRGENSVVDHCFFDGGYR